jgi:hypothetical protein
VTKLGKCQKQVPYSCASDTYQGHDPNDETIGACTRVPLVT